MPIHDWTRVGPGILHGFHLSWVVEIQKALNNGLLPSNYYAMVEQTEEQRRMMASSLNPFEMPFMATEEGEEYAMKRRTIAIRHSSDDRRVGLIEILSPGNKTNRHAIRAFLSKALSALDQHLHLLVVDLHPRSLNDPQGVHDAIWAEISGNHETIPSEKPFTLVAYEAAAVTAAYLEPIQVGDVLPDMPLFLAPGVYIPMPLEATYLAAWSGMPLRWKRVLEE